MQVNEIPMGSLIDQDKIKTILSDSVYMDIFSDGVDVLRQGNDTTLTLTDLIHPLEHASQIGKVFVAEWLCIVQIGGYSTARILMIICLFDKDKKDFENTLKSTTGKLNINISKTVTGYPDSNIETKMSLDSKMIKVFFFPTNTHLKPSWAEEAAGQHQH